MIVKKTDVLPIGTLVLLKGTDKDLMITESYISDKKITYKGLPYPYGYISDEIFKIFTNSDIEDIHFYGYNSIDFQNYAKGFHILIGKGSDKR